MAPQWTIEEDRALLLSLVQVMAPNGPSKHQFDGAREILKDRWTLSAITQHYNKKLRLLAPSTMDAAGTGSTPATPVKSATKRKAPASASKAAAVSASTSPAPATKGRGRKKAAAKAVKEEPVDDPGDDDEGREDDEGGAKTPTKKAKVAESTEEE